jgi:hypothetical protein
MILLTAHLHPQTQSRPLDLTHQPTHSTRYEARHGKKVDREAFSAAFKNKYQLNIDGTVAA